MVRRLQDGLLNTMAETVTICDSPAAISFHPLVSTGAPYSATDGAPLMDDPFEIFCYDATDHVIWEKQARPAGYDFSNNARPLQLSESALRAACGVADRNDRVVAHHVRSVSFASASGSGGVLTLPVVINVTTCVPVARGGEGRGGELGVELFDRLSQHALVERQAGTPGADEQSLSGQPASSPWPLI